MCSILKYLLNQKHADHGNQHDGERYGEDRDAKYHGDSEKSPGETTFYAVNLNSGSRRIIYL